MGMTREVISMMARLVIVCGASGMMLGKQALKPESDAGWAHPKA